MKREIQLIKNKNKKGVYNIDAVRKQGLANVKPKR